MSYVKVWIHAVWGAKGREHLLTKEVRSLVIAHIRENAKQKEIYIDRLNGYTDHLHCLFGLNADTTIAKTLQLIKGESAWWMNKDKMTPVKFEWANEYYAVSVSESALEDVRAYVDNQEEHHKKKTYAGEVEEFLENTTSRAYLPKMRRQTRTKARAGSAGEPPTINACLPSFGG